ncbi:MAG: two-component system cell cycle sensor histidine kinase/response regulator CckA [Planctomycetota bacterium]|jgi:two-component system cell cycle sensor histidine kinase/response regulator CckA
MWFATRGGVVSYDGRRWRMHTGSTKGTWKCVVPTVDDAFWAINNHAPVYVSHSDATGVHNSSAAPLPIDCLPALLRVTENGTAIVSTNQHGVATLEDEVWSRITIDGEVDYDVYAIVCRDSELLIGAANGLWRVQLDDPTLAASKVDGLPNGNIFGLAQDGGDTWIAMEGWVGKMNHATGDIRAVLADPKLEMAKSAASLEPDRLGSVFVSNHLSVHRVHDSGKLSTWGRAQGLLDASATDVLVDQEGNVWVASMRGLSKVVANNIVSYTSKHGLYADEVSAICRRRAKDYVLGHNGGLTLFAGGEFKTIAIDGLPSLTRVLDLDVDANDVTWVAGSWRGLGQLSIDNELTWHETPKQVSSVVAQGDDVLVATNDGLWLFNDGNWSRHPCEHPVLREPVRRLQRDGTGGVWACTAEQGVYRLHANGQLQQWQGDTTSRNNTYAITEWRGRMLVGSDAGLLEIAGKSLQPTTDIAIDSSVFAFTSDAPSQSLWVGTTKGITVVGNGEQRQIGAAIGLLGYEVNRDAMFVDQNGLVCVGTNRGLNLLSARSRPRPRSAPRLAVTAATANSTEVTFDFRIDSYINEKAVEFRYQLEGLSDEWTDPVRYPNRKLRFASLPAGDYRLHLTATTPDGRTSAAVTSTFVHVAGPIYRRVWFLVALVLAGTTLAFGAFRYAGNRRYAHRLEQEVGDRTKQLATSEQAAKQDREQLAITMDSIADGVAATDSAGRIFLWNRAATQHTGRSQREVIGGSLQQVLGLPKDLPTSGNMRLGLGANPTEERGFEASIAVFGEGEGRVVAFRDISQRIANERGLAHRQRLESLGLLAGGIAHDFNNYLTVILGTLTMLEHEDSLSSDQLSQVQLASSTIGRAEELTKQLLTFSTGGAPVRATIPVAKLLHDAIAIALSGSQLASSVEAPSDLPPARIDAGQVSQVLHNLLLNARQAMPNGGTITVSATLLDEVRIDLQPGEWIAITVADNGPGMSHDVQQRIFDPFYSGRESTGLGLAVAHSIITRHGGTIRVQSKPGNGTTFELLLPVSHERIVGNAPATPTAVPANLRFLVMDDEPTIRKMFGKMLAHLGHDFITVPDGDAAVQSYSESVQQGRPFDMAMFDLTVAGGIGGQEAASMLLAKYPDARLVAVSGYSTDSVLGQSAENGFCASMAKPFSLKTLRETIAKVVNPEAS